LGKKIEERSLTNYTTTLNTSNWTAGVYFLQLEVNGEKAFQEFVKQ